MRNQDFTDPGSRPWFFATCDISANQRIAKYSGNILTAEEADASNSKYLLYVNKKKTMDAEGPEHMVGKYINDGKISGKAVNARYGSSLRTFTCKITGRRYK